jgi:lipopolysaccharide export system permease protein
VILHRYFARRFALTFLMVFGLFLVISVLLDLIEQLRLYSGRDTAFGDILTLTLLNTPQSLYRILPLVMILATIGLFLSLARSSEMVVTRAAGRSALRALVAPVIVTLVIGAIGVAVFNPIVAATSRQAELRAGVMSGQDNVLNISSDGLWLRQGTERGQTVIRAVGTNLDGTELRDATFITFTFAEGPTRRIEADQAELTSGAWLLHGVKIWPLSGAANPEAEATALDAYEIPSTLTPDQIRDSFGAPSSIPIWELPGFISRLETAGFAARRHQMWFQSELALPIFLVAVVLIASGFTMRHQRGGRVGLMVLTAILLSFGLYFLRNFAAILGESGQIPIALAAWAPPLAGVALSLGFLLHLEDG